MRANRVGVLAFFAAVTFSSNASAAPVGYTSDKVGVAVYLNDPVQKKFVLSSPYSNSGNKNAVNQSVSVTTGATVVGVYPSGLRYADINGDGLVDAFYSQEQYVISSQLISTNQVYLNTGAAFAYDASYSSSLAGLSRLFASQWFSNGNYGFNGWIDNGFMPVDVNGDDAADIVQMLYRTDPATNERSIAKSSNYIAGYPTSAEDVFFVLVPKV